MSTLLALVPVAGCAAMMLLCAGMMRRGGKSATADSADPAEVAQLRAEVADLRTQLEPTAQPERDVRPAR